MLPFFRHFSFFSIIICSLIIFPSCVFLLASSFFLVCPMFFFFLRESYSCFFLYLSVSLSLFSSISCFLIFFSSAVFVYPLFVLTHLSFPSFDIDLFVFILLLYFFFPHLHISISKKNQNFLWWTFEDEMSFFLPSLLRCLVSCFFLLASSIFLVCSIFLLILSVSWNYFSWSSFLSIFFLGLWEIIQ